MDLPSQVIDNTVLTDKQLLELLGFNHKEGNHARTDPLPTMLKKSETRHNRHQWAYMSTVAQTLSLQDVALFR